ncbi:MAG TPA: nucleotidyltransferase family protein, partial [Burkholderiales bacterium]|nr:nucleotidyltransferase family protein [Burkholderiales bacterium]
QIRAACIAVESSQTAVRFEINRVLRALTAVDAPIILLKGAAYLMADLPPARGRFVGDLDLMVPQARIPEVERTLIAQGWAPADLEEYDQRYYREWMHEIPPLQHPQRETPVDIHHTIAPRTSRMRPDPEALLLTSVALANSRLRVLAPADMVLHSTLHLFNDEVGAPLRDLLDLHDLLCHFGTRTEFWDELLSHAQLHGLGRPLYYMLRHTQRLLGTPVPPEVDRRAAASAPAPPLKLLMDSLFATAFVPKPVTQSRSAAGFARLLLYLRSHWLRMPPILLMRHLTIKAVRRARERFERQPTEAG